MIILIYQKSVLFYFLNESMKILYYWKFLQWLNKIIQLGMRKKNLHSLAFSNFLFVMSWSSIIIPPWKITNSRISCCYYSHYTIYFSQIFKIYYIDGFTSNSSQLKLGWNLGKRQRLWVSLLLFKTCTVYTVSK